MKKIVHVVECFGGGVFTFLVNLVAGLTDSYEVYIAYSQRAETPENLREYFNSKVKFIELKNFHRNINPVNEIKACFELKRIVKDIEPDVVHLHSSKAGVIGRIVLNCRKRKVFYTPHGYSFLMKDQSKVKRFIYRFIEKAAALRRCVTISCSKGENRESAKLTSRVACVSNGIDIKSLDSKISRLEKKKNEKFTVFTLGRISYQKNPALFNKVALMLPQVNFIWIGDGELRNEITADNITITGWLEHEEAIKTAYNSDAFMLTSLWEGLPISLLEAMYMKKTCIVSDVIGNNDTIENNVNGFVCTTAEEFKKAVLLAMEDKTSSMVKKAYEDICNEYNTDVMTQKYIGLYNDM